jgi:hypothetical protein
MAKKSQDDQLLRKVFDGVYREVDAIQQVDSDRVKQKLQRTARVNRRAMGWSMVAVALSFLLVAFLYATQAFVDHNAWVNRPSFATRLAAPYSLESKYPPLLTNAVTVDAEVEQLLTFITANIQYYEPKDEPKASQLLSQVIQLQSIVPAQISNYRLEWNRTQETLLTQCVLSMGLQEDMGCENPYSAEFIESANFVDTANEENTVSLIMTKFADDEQAIETIDAIYSYARKIGQIGNFSFSDLHNVDYFYSLTRKGTSFTWLNENWVISVSANKMSTIHGFMDVFPLYENNPDLANFPVIQIPQQVIPTPTPEPTAEATEESLTDSVSGTE